MADASKWALDTTDELRKGLEWVRRRSGALMVIAIRSSDFAWAAPAHMTAEHKAKLLAELGALIAPQPKQEERGDAWEPEEVG